MCPNVCLSYQAPRLGLQRIDPPARAVSPVVVDVISRGEQCAQAAMLQSNVVVSEPRDTLSRDELLHVVEGRRRYAQCVRDMESLGRPAAKEINDIKALNQAEENLSFNFLNQEAVVADALRLFLEHH